ncbi:N-acetylmuramoyl-L-alanine amidase [Streptomyces sp. NPDC051642]|uniref:N-acetylmuramoyl-L-alanine amidase n=1 Tax=Streptomyces sp. NPDC051642 TaxID=3154646 RepID=UPI00342DF6C8
MATPMTPAQWRTALQAEGVKFTEYSNWTTRGRDSATGKTFGPVHGVLNHHTAGSNSLKAVAVDGAPALPAPLCHTFLPKTGIAVMVSCHRANHAGLAASNVIAAIINEKTLPKQNKATTVDGNDCLYGIETENLGDGKDAYTKAQYDAWVRWNAAICRHHGWGSGSAAGHLETSVEGKIDPKGPVEGYGSRGKFTFSMKQLRADVAERLKHAASWSPGTSSTYTVASGDTLWSIAAAKLGDGNRWQEIATLNGLLHADAIAPGQKLKLPPK